ncbi:MAG: VWA domain-containing protein [Thermoflexales bacterium]|nr:VWA domain-containing protein [Thermoflexales bacterium]
MRAPTLTRRQFLALVAATSLGLKACGASEQAEPTPTSAPTTTPTASPPIEPTLPPLGFFDALEVLRRAVRASPDHLLARAERLVEARDAEGLVRFVREFIAVCPASENDMGNAVTGWRWGKRATLRGGSGTPREVAELLAELLNRAGFQAEVVEASATELRLPRTLTTAEVMRSAATASFSPALDEATRAAVQRALNLPEPKLSPSFDPQGRESAALAEALLSAFGGEAKAPAPFRTADPVIFLPSVQVLMSGERRLVNLWAQQGPVFLPLERKLRPAPPHRPPLTVSVRVEAAHSHAPADRFVLVERAWSAEEVAGRQVEIAFVPPARSLDEALSQSQHSVRARRPMLTPVLLVRGPDLDAAATRELSSVGNPFTLAGQVVREQSNGLNVNGQPLPPVRPLGNSPLIAAAEFTLQASTFPLITLEVTPRDAQGNIIENLAAAHFLIEEDGKPVQAVMERWARPAPRVLFLLDDSGSIPAEFRFEGAQALVQAVAEQIKAADPRAQFRIAKIFEGTADARFTQWTDEPRALAEQVRRASGWGSRLWEALADAGRLGASVIVMITDGQAVSAAGERLTEPPPELAAAVRAGPPAVVIGVGETDPAMLEHLGQAGRLGAFSADSRDAAIGAIVRVLSTALLPPYRFSYYAREGADAPRSVRLFELYGAAERPSKKILAETTYTPPQSSARATPPALSGLFLSVTVGSQTVVRVLAGLAAKQNEERPTAEHLEEVRRALQGRFTLAFEAGAPSLAQILDDAYTAILSLRPVLEKRDRGERLKALATSLLYAPPPDLHLASLPLADDPNQPMTFETGLRVTLHCVLPTQTPEGQLAARQWVDLLPLAGFRTADADPSKAFRLTVQRTARLALAEAAAFPEHNTLKLVRGKPMRQARYDYQVNEALKAQGLSEVERRRLLEVFAPWLGGEHLLLFPADGTPAGWAVSRQGAVWGVLGGEGAKTAGGGSRLSPVKALEAALLVSDLMTLIGIGGFSFAGGVWLVFAATMYKKLESATALIAQLPTSADDPAPDLSGAEKVASLDDVACALAQTFAFEAISRTGTFLFHRQIGRATEYAVAGVSAVDGALSLLTGRGLFCD